MAETTPHTTHQAPAAPARSNPNPGQNPSEGAKKQAAEDREARAKAVADRLKGRPTPTQEELDAIALGQHVELSPDGSDPDPSEKLSTVHHVGGEHMYQHRQMKSKS